MMQLIMTYGMLVVAAIALWYPGFMMSRNMVRAVSEREPTMGENILACFPGFNLAIGRRELYGSAKLVWIPMIICWVLAVLKIMFYFLFNSAWGVLISTVITYLFLVSVVVMWLCTSFVLFDIGRCVQVGTLAKLLAFIMPPVSCYFIGRDCRALMAIALEELQQEERLDEDEGDYY